MSESDLCGGDTGASSGAMDRLNRLRCRVARAIMPEEAVRRQEKAELRVENEVNMEYFEIGAGFGYQLALDERRTSKSDYRVEGDLE